MNVIYSAHHKGHNPDYELYEGVKTAYPEVLDRIEVIAAALRSVGHQFVTPRSYEDRQLFALHPRHYQDYVRQLSERADSETDCYPSNFIHDTYAPLQHGTYRAARQALSAALTGADRLLGGEELVYSLCRPPGHHAGDVYMGGYCYFNNAALAAHHLRQRGRVAILDIDYHHGNGTQQLFCEQSDVLYVSVHADPTDSYPYTHGFTTETGKGSGVGYTRNIVVPPNCGADAYQAALDQAIRAVADFAPDYLVVSLGFDGYKDDPIAGFGLDIQDYREIAQKVSQLQKPTLLIQEGGYCVEALGELAQVFSEALMAGLQTRNA